MLLTKLLKVLGSLFDSALFMHDHYSNRLPSTFSNFVKSINKVHHYANRLASKKSYYLTKVRTNYGKIYIRFSGMLLTKISNQRIVFALKSFYQNLSSPNIDWCTLFAANRSAAIVLFCFFVYSFVYLFVFVCICLFIKT